MSVITISLAGVAMLLFILNVYQYLTQRAALRIAEILYIMSRHIREKASEVRREQKDVEIVEAHLFDITTSARSLLRSLGRSEDSLGPDPTTDLSPNNGNRLDSESLVRLADNILYSVIEGTPEANWDAIVNKALERFREKVPSLDQEAAKRIMVAVARQSERDSNGPPTFSIADQTKPAQ